MITNEAYLQEVRDQVARVERALLSIHREVRPRSECTYRVMAEGYADQLAALRAEIDAYFGIEEFVAAAGEEDDPVPETLDGPRLEVVGTLRALDLDRQTFILRERPDAALDLCCRYDKPLEETVMGFLGTPVLVAGPLLRGRRTQRLFLIVQALLASTYEEVGGPSKARAS